MAVSLPEYARLREMQGKALKLDRMMKQLMQTMGPEKLKASKDLSLISCQLELDWEVYTQGRYMHRCDSFEAHFGVLDLVGFTSPIG